MQTYVNLVLLLYVAIQSAQAQDTLRITLQDAVRIALSDNPTIKVAGQEILLKKEARREAYAGLSQKPVWWAVIHEP